MGTTLANEYNCPEEGPIGIYSIVNKNGEIVEMLELFLNMHEGDLTTK